MSNRIALGIVRKPHGIRGEASVEPWTDTIDRFFDLKSVTLVSPGEDETREVRIESMRPHSGRLLIKFEEIDSPEDLRDVQNWTVEIPEADARKLDEGEYFIHDLVGLRLVDKDGHDRGVVTEANEGGGGVLLTIKHDGRRYDLPFAATICTEIDIAKKRMVVNIPEGLDDLASVRSIEDDLKANHGDTEALRVDFVTIFPKMFEPLLAEGVIAQGIKKKLLDIRVWDLRDYATDKHRSTDDEAYGGGPGMVMLGEPVLRAVEAVRESAPDRKPHLVLTSPQGRLFTQGVARELAAAKWLVILCGRYEGFDQRVIEILQPEEISVGDFVVSGGELPAMLMADAAARMIEGVVGNTGSVEEDSFFNGLLDYPHYTRPDELRGRRVPEILMSGHHENIRKWRREQALRATIAKRPDLLEKIELDEEARQILYGIEPAHPQASPPRTKRKRT